MERSRQLRHLEEAEQHVLRGAHNISDQEERIEELDRRGHDTTLARSLFGNIPLDANAIRCAPRSNP